MRLIIAGSRHLNPNFNFITQCIKLFELINIHEIVCGQAEGIDRVGEIWSQEYNIPITNFYPEWNKYGKSAGPKRNKKMAEYADALLLIHSNTKGSLSMKKEMKKQGKPIYEVILNKDI